MDTSTTASGEALLRVWLSLTAVICNRRMVSGLTFNEAVVCNHLLYQQEEAPSQSLTATDLCQRTNLLKSQMNQVLSSLERQGYLIRRRSEADRRQVHLCLTESGREAYHAAHRQAAVLLTELVNRIGVEKADTLTAQLTQIIAVIQDIQERQKGTL